MKHHSLQQYSQDLGMAVHDTWTTTRVKSALAKAGSALSLHVHVKTHAGLVTLSGRVLTHRQCEQAIDLARAVPGVMEVDGRELLTHVFMPGANMEAPNAEESNEYHSPLSGRKEDDR
ncbi:hyperosmotically inducible protein [Pseudomonas sp. ok272]|uniref:BON domain-containing protein n=1 Tax=unclassified Pseudomonas TaxID=196821 RepID=UPI0008C64223|nr:MULTISPECIES: BON domain-containing protein [unclassified Pseudomonas]SEN51666.1 hyperosmotically inducible protein [Pseudomonas sp. ok272]SFN32651.1 hyperosmotically inducible protein [Pseudomonas sp. ok602]